MVVYVVMGNDYPDAVFKEQSAAEAYCLAKNSENRKGQRRIYWRFYSFELQ
jgi:hypothetical protein